MVLIAGSQCLGNEYGRLVSINYDKEATRKAGKEPFKVTIQSSDKEVEVELKNGEKIGLNQVSTSPINTKGFFGGVNPHKKRVYTLNELTVDITNKAKNKGRVYTLDELKSFSFTIPWERWDGDATIHVKVMSGDTLVSQMDLQDRDSAIKFINIKNAQESKNYRKVRTVRRFNNNGSYVDKKVDCSWDVSLNVAPDTGRLTIGTVKLVKCDGAGEVFEE